MQNKILKSHNIAPGNSSYINRMKSKTTDHSQEKETVASIRKEFVIVAMCMGS